MTACHEIKFTKLMDIKFEMKISRQNHFLDIVFIVQYEGEDFIVTTIWKLHD
jgi:hypothetical protein